MFAVQKNMRTFVVPNFRIAVESFDLSANRFHTAGSFRCISSDNRRYGSLATQRKGLASFVVSLPQTFAHMPNFSKSSEAQGAVSAPKKYSTLKSEERQYQKHLYKVSLLTVGKFADDFKSGAFHGDIYEAVNEDAALGMAVKHVAKKFPGHVLNLAKYEVSLLNPLA